MWTSWIYIYFSFVFLPLTLKAQEYFFKDNYIVYQKKELTPNYFRQDKNEVYYFTENLSTQPFKKDPVSTVKIDTSADGSIEITEEIVSKWRNFLTERKKENKDK